MNFGRGLFFTWWTKDYW